MFGPMAWVPGQMVRARGATKSVSEHIASAPERNEKLVNKVRASGDAQLDKLAWEKTMPEEKTGGLIGPFA